MGDYNEIYKVQVFLEDNYCEAIDRTFFTARIEDIDTREVLGIKCIGWREGKSTILEMESEWQSTGEQRQYGLSEYIKLHYGGDM